MANIKFNGIENPSYMLIHSITDSLLPKIETRTLKISGRKGLYNIGSEIGERLIKVSLSILGQDEADLRTKIRAVANWLCTEKPAKFVNLDEPDKYYMAQLTGDSELEEILRKGSVELEFICTNPFAYEDPYIDSLPKLPSDNTLKLLNDGGLETHPTLKMEFTSNTPEFSIVSSDEFLLFGTSPSGDQLPMDREQLVFQDEMHSITGWTNASSIDGGIITGTLSADENGMLQADSDYGTGSSWHGASMVKDLGVQLQDFKVVARIGLRGTKALQKGRVEVYLRDINGAVLGKMAFVDNAVTGFHPKAEARAGTLNDGHYFVNSYGSYPGVWKDLTNGHMEIERHGNEWRAYFAIYENGKYHTRLTKTWIDARDEWTTGKLAQVQVHVGASGSATPASLMRINDLKVYGSQSVSEIEIANVFTEGDILEINNATGEILKNGKPYYSTLNPASNFIKLKKGVNGIAINPPIVKEISYTIPKKWY
ncbi:phage tail family protein [Cytobacillus kochii]|uniref:distal tail protein Dit n=1 Tax=Cytobacillus kochii TaxID=859143 RepID=UPI001CD62BD6|nr:distal tail protein Dit [Cytobacillus kochii]MCA1025790.1 phage tail family protein [Cytobacillus kochii]